MKQKIGRRLSVLIVAAAMSVLMLPATALAYSSDTTNDGDEVVSITTSAGATYYYTTLADAITDAQEGDTVTLLDNVTLTETLYISGKDITLDLGGKTLTGRLNIEKGSNVTIKNGTIENPNGQAVNVYAASNSDSSADPTVVYIASDVTIQNCYYGVCLFPITASTHAACYGLQVTIDGNVSGINGVFVQGNLTGCASTDYLIINGTVTSTGTAGQSDAVGLAVNGYMNVTVSGSASISGPTGIEVRAGDVTIKDGATITATATESNCTSNGNGTTTYGVALAVVQHTTNLEINVTVEGGTFEGVYAVYEQDVEDSTSTGAISISLEGGTYTGSTAAVVVEDSDEVTTEITGGSYSSDVGDYLVNSDGNGDGSTYVLLANENGTYSAMTETEAQNSDAVTTVTYTADDGSTYTVYYLTTEAAEEAVKSADGSVADVPTQYKVSFVDGLTDEEITYQWVTANGNVDTTLITDGPGHENYTFTGWSYDGATYTAEELATKLADDAITSNVTITAVYTAVEDDADDTADSDDTIASTGDDTNILVFGAIALLAASGAFVARKKLFVK